MLLFLEPDKLLRTRLQVQLVPPAKDSAAGGNLPRRFHRRWVAASEPGSQPPHREGFKDSNERRSVGESFRTRLWGTQNTNATASLRVSPHRSSCGRGLHGRQPQCSCAAHRDDACLQGVQCRD